jgi:hypothetical protein
VCNAGFIRDIHVAHPRAGFAVRVCHPANAVGAVRLHPGYGSALEMMLQSRTRDACSFVSFSEQIAHGRWREDDGQHARLTR